MFSNPRVHLQEGGCRYSYGKACLHASVYAKKIYEYKNIKEKLYKTNTEIWYNNMIVYTASYKQIIPYLYVNCDWNVTAHAQKPDFVFRAKRTSPFKSDGWRQFSRLLAAEVCASAVVMLDTPRSVVMWRVLATHCIRQFPLHFPSRASPCSITFQLESTEVNMCRGSVYVEASWNVMTHAQKPDFVFRAKRISPFKSAGGRQFSWILAAELCASAVVMLDTPCSEVVWRVLATHSIRQFPLHFPSLRHRVPWYLNWSLQPSSWRWILGFETRRSH